MFKKTSVPPPRYRVRFPTGERELAAPEILEAYQRREIHFSTLIAPLGEADFRRLDADPGFQVLLPRLYRQQKTYLSPWTPLVIFWWLPVALGLMAAILPFGLIRGVMVIIGFYLNLLLPLFLVEYCVLQPSARLQKRFSGLVTLWIPYWNAFVGFRIFSQLIQDLPPQRRRTARVLNGLFWGSWALFLLGNALLPGGTSGGIALFVIVSLLTLAAGGLGTVFRLGTAEIFRRWKRENPPPGSRPPKRVKWYQFSNDIPPPMPSWAKDNTVNPVSYFVCLALGVAIYFLPYYLDGIWHYHREMACLPYRVTAEPPEPVMSLPEVPDSANEFLGFRPRQKMLPETVKAELRAQRPALEEFRKQLRQQELSPNMLCTAKDESCHNFPHYMHWRQLEYHLSKPQERPALAEDLFADLDALFRTQNRGTTQALLLLSSWNFMRLQLLESELLHLPETRLLAEKAFFQTAEQRLAATVAKLEYLTFQDFFRHMLSERELRYGYAPFLHGVQATWLRLNRLGVTALAMDQCDGKPHWQKLDRYSRDVLLFFLTNWTSLGKHVSRQRAVSRLATAAIELELYRRQHGVYPDTAELPRDPFSGAPLRYVPGKLLYSVNTDGIDDGGRAKRRHQGDSTDMAFHLEQPSAKEQ